MREATGNIFEMKNVDVLCVLTNTTVKANGDLIMGGGQALEARRLYPSLPERWGRWYTQHRDPLCGLIWESAGSIDKWDRSGSNPYALVSFPTKDNPGNDSTIDMITMNAVFLAAMIDAITEFSNLRVYCPRPGVGLGGLTWADVKPVLTEIWDDRFTVCTFA